MRRGFRYGDRKARAHLKQEHRCPRCGRVIMGNAYFYHEAKCLSPIHPDTQGQQCKRYK